MKLIPMNDKITARQVKKGEGKTKAGLILPIDDTENNIMEIIDTAEGIDCVKSGDKVYCAKYCGEKVFIDGGREIFLIEKSDILAIIG